MIRAFRLFLFCAMMPALACLPSGECEGRMMVGATYSPRQSEYLGMDWKETYLSVLDMGFEVIRLGAYWSAIEKEKDTYDFAALDWQIAEAQKRGIPVVLTVGMKAPRWPEYFIPEWVLEKARLAFGADVAKNAYLRKRTLKFIERTVLRYRDRQGIYCWQVENEPLNRYGGKYWYIGAGFLRQEIELVRTLDEGRRPVLLTTATYPNKVLRMAARLFLPHDPVEESLEMCDIIGLNVYPEVGHAFWRMKLYFRAGRKERDTYFSALLARAKDAKKQAWIAELQAEPWEPGQLVHKDEKAPVTGSIGTAKEIFREFREMGVDAILFWGAEYWHFRNVRYGDRQWQDAFCGMTEER